MNDSKTHPASQGPVHNIHPVFFVQWILYSAKEHEGTHQFFSISLNFYLLITLHNSEWAVERIEEWRLKSYVACIAEYSRDIIISYFLQWWWLHKWRYILCFRKKKIFKKVQVVSSLRFLFKNSCHKNSITKCTKLSIKKLHLAVF